MEITVRRYEDAEIEKLVGIWNEVVEDGAAFPQEELLSARVGESVKVFIPAYTEKHSDAAADVYECRIEAEGCVYLYLAGIEGLTQNLSIKKDIQNEGGFFMVRRFGSVDLDR